jgi:hypothetical protein
MKERDQYEDIRIWEDTIKMNLIEIGWGFGLDSTGLG